MKDRLKKILSDELKIDSEVVRLDKLHGDASYRTYYRASMSDGSSFVIMEMPAGKSSVSEEITNFKGSMEELPFINVCRYLKEAGIPVPKIYRYDASDLIMVLEDLGNAHFSQAVEGADGASRIPYYKKAIDLLIEIQSKTDKGPSDKCIAFKRSFDESLLNWEFDHFLEFAVEERLESKVAEKDLKIFNAETRKISKRIQSMPYGFTLRDYQSRNIMIRDDRFYIIDFQDALLGPKLYDLVSLLRDSYVELDGNALDELVGYYAALSRRPISDARREFDLITVQRKMKDAGRFVYIDRIKKNPNYLKFIPASLRYARKALNNLPEHKALLEVLKKYIPEWKRHGPE